MINDYENIILAINVINIEWNKIKIIHKSSTIILEGEMSEFQICLKLCYH